MAMTQLQVLSRWSWRLICLLVLSLPSFCNAAEATRALTVREAGAPLYAQQEAESDKIATLQKGQLLTPLAEAVGQQTWYMVKTSHGLVGWVRAVDVSAGDQLRQAFKEQSKRSSWSARTTTGRTFEGSWTVEPASSADKASGTWTLGEASIRPSCAAHGRRKSFLPGGAAPGGPRLRGKSGNSPAVGRRIFPKRAKPL